MLGLREFMGVALVLTVTFNSMGCSRNITNNGQLKFEALFKTGTPEETVKECNEKRKLKMVRKQSPETDGGKIDELL